MQSEKTSIQGFFWRNLTDEELDAFSSSIKEGNFQQTSHMKHLELLNYPNAQVSIVGVVDKDDVVLAATEIIFVHTKFGVMGNIWCGPLCDPNNKPLLQAMSDAIYACAKRVKAYCVQCVPNDVYMKRDSFGNPDGDPNSQGVENYKDLHWEHKGFDRGYGGVLCRWMYVKDLTGISNEQELVQSFSKNTKRNVKIAQKSCVQVRQLKRDELSIFHDICGLSSERQGFKNRTESYSRNFYDSYGDLAHFMVAEIHLDKYLQVWEDKLQDARKEITQLEPEEQQGTLSDKRANRLKTARQNEQASLKRIENAKEYIQEDGTVVPVAAALFVADSHELVYLMSGSNDKYAKFYAPTALQAWAMNWCIEHGLTRYNFYGISGYFDNENDPGHGVLEFKQGFNGNVEEMFGEFTLPVKPLQYKMKKFVYKILGHQIVVQSNIY